jgi:hypothetical protein
MDETVQQVLTPNGRRFLRFVGKLWENGEFEPGIGWETTRISRRPVRADGYSLELLDDQDRVLVEAGVEVRVPICRVKVARGMSGRRVNGYLPFVPNGRVLVFRKDERTFYRAAIAASAPRLSITSVKATSHGRVQVRWDARHDRDLRFSVVLLDAQNRSVSVARGLTESHLDFSVTDLPGGPGCTVAVLATDGLRSSTARSETIDLPQHPPMLTILTPNDGGVIAPGQIVSLVGHARDAAGRPLTDDGLVWSVDDQVIARGQRMIPAGPFEPGEHRVELAYVLENQPRTRFHIRLRVPDRTPEQDAWRAIAATMRVPGFTNSKGH